jgi:hypothetical protein
MKIKGLEGQNDVVEYGLVKNRQCGDKSMNIAHRNDGLTYLS